MMTDKNKLRILPALALLALGQMAYAEEPATESDSARCANIAVPKGVKLEHAPALKNIDGLPEFCQVRGQIDGHTNFELRMPKEWNGRFVMAGCGGFCGALRPDNPGYSNSINEALKKGYAAISHDGGHTGTSSDSSWAFDDPEALQLYAHKVLPVVTGVGKAISESFYQKAPHHTYYSGCSNGGRLGMMAAQRYPELFDGIAAGGSIFDMSEIAGKWGNWMINQTTDHGTPVFDRSKNALIKNAIMQKCDGIDGQKDGIIDDPRACSFDFSELQCDGDATNTAQCLTGDEASALNRLYGGVRNAKGEKVAESLMLGSENYTDFWLFGTEEQPGWGFAASTGYRQLLSQDLFGKDQPEPLSTETMQSWISKSSIVKLIDADDTDLSHLKANDTKLMIYHGWSDPLIIPQPMVNYYEQAAAANGGISELAKNARLFMIPGWGHCWERPAEAPAEFDPLDVVAQWVETGKAPDQFVANQRDKEGQVVRTRPICAYPEKAQLIEGENPDRAESYQCRLESKNAVVTSSD